jgi:uncharacterized protein (TIGR03067 family)
MRSCCLLAATALCLIAAQKPDDAVKKELAKLQGTWKFISLEAGGNKLPEDNYKDAVLLIEGDKHTTKHGPVTYSGTLKIDPSKKPKTIDVHFTDGPEKGKTSFGIYELDGETLKICIGLVDKPRPSEFASKAGSGHVLEVLKREKKD